MSTTLLCFGATFVSVFALGVQSQNVNQGHYLAAAVTSLFISAGHIGLYKYMPAADGLEVLGYAAGGITGITASMWFHRSVKAWWRGRRRRDEHTDVQHCGYTPRRMGGTRTPPPRSGSGVRFP